MASRRSLCLAVLLGASLCSPVSARRLPTRVFTVADGLPQNEIASLFEDSRGFLWVGTTDGLARFDGRNFAVYGVSQGLPHPAINDMLEAPDGSLWLATGGGVARFAVTESSPSAAALRTFHPGPTIGANQVFRLLRDRRGRLWAGTADGLFVLDAGAASFRPVALNVLKPPNVSLVNAASLAESPEGDLWVGTAWGLVRILSGGRQVRYLPSSPQFARGVRDLHLDAAGRLWICWDRNATVYRPVPPPGGVTEIGLDAPGPPCAGAASLSPPTGGTCGILEPDPPPDFFASVNESRSGELRLLTGRGVFLAAADGLKRDETAASFAAAILTCVLEDRHGSFWLGTQSGGLVRIARTGLSTYGGEDGLLGDKINSIFEDSSGALCVSTTGGAVHRLAEDRFAGVQPALPRGLSYLGWGWNQIVLQDRAGEWWYATGEGAVRYPATSRIEDLAGTLPRKVYTARDGLRGNNVFRLFEDSRGDVWIATIGAGEEGLVRWERSTDTIRVELTRPEIVPVSAIAEDRAGNIWIGGYTGGLARRREGNWEVLSPGGRTSRGFISQIFRDSAGRLWIATRLGGLLRVDEPSSANPSFRSYGSAQGLASDRTNAVTEDGSGHIYVAASRGIDRLDPASSAVRHYTAAEGLASTKTVTAFRDRHGRLWFGTLQGLFRFDPLLEAHTRPPTVLLRALEAGGKRYAVAASGTRATSLPDLPWGSDPLRVEFVSPSLAPAEQVRFRYRLKGRSGDWSDPTADASVQYAGLASGRYTFEVEAVASDGTRSMEPASVGFRILPPLWQRWWFLAAAVLLVGGALAWLHRQRVAGLLAVERVRSRIAADLHDDLGTSLYRISILSELAGRQAGEREKDVRPILSDIGETARDLIESAGDMVWSVDPRHDNLGNLTARVRRYASEMLEARGIAGSLESPENAEEIFLAAETRRELYLIFKEAIRNALRHGLPSHVALRLAVNDGHLAAEIRDDGTGLAEAPETRGEDGAGYGLRTMRRRAETLGGVFQVISRPGEGTRILVDVPLRPRA